MYIYTYMYVYINVVCMNCYPDTAYFTYIYTLRALRNDCTYYGLGNAEFSLSK